MISPTVKKTRHKDEDVWYNTITRKVLPITCTDQELRNNFFLEGQEKQAIELFLTKNVGILSFSIIPTWECNLRCTH